IQQQLALRLHPRLWIEAFHHWGHLQNLVLMNGLVLVNRTDQITSSSGARCYWSPSTRLSLRLDVTTQQASTGFASDEQSAPFTTYSIHSFTTVLSWLF
ncbi:hypothetical protein RZS08_24355, partial [Arthrospira platensis SPKY1]|nr:hypothetical protein [Arthrospira platensis SPKY1]